MPSLYKVFFYSTRVLKQPILNLYSFKHFFMLKCFLSNIQIHSLESNLEVSTLSKDIWHEASDLPPEVLPPYN